VISLLVLLLGLLVLPSAALGAGELDPTFDGDGKVETSFGEPDVFFNVARAVAIQADGKIVAAGTGTAFALARYNPDGSLDPTFDGDGKVETAFNDAYGVAIQADGKIVAAGVSESFVGPDTDLNFALARYNPDGSLDPTFDGDGKVVTGFEEPGRRPVFDVAKGVAIEADGKIVVAGESGDPGGDPRFNFALARYNPDGSLDPAFDGDGRVLTDFGGLDDRAHGVAIQADGKIVAAGSSPDADFTFGFVAFALARYNADGSLDSTFDGDGRVLTAFGEFDEARGVAIQADGKIVAAGKSHASVGPPFSPADFALARYNPDGSLDPAFDGDGKALTDFSNDDEAHGLAIQADGKIVAAGVSAGPGFSNPDFALTRHNPDGSLDAAFDGDGRVLTDFGGGASGIAIQSDGKIVAAGSSFRDFALARYLDGPPANLPPDCSTVEASPKTLRPPNHRFHLVTLSGATDPDSHTVTLTITDVTQDEPLDGAGDGNTSPDARGGTQSNEVRLRAERSARGDGRVYRVSFTGSDGEGGSCEGAVTVPIPHDQGRAAVDSAPPSFNSFGP
jgi:uncharacterized delta-60 repeat protein